MKSDGSQVRRVKKCVINEISMRMAKRDGNFHDFNDVKYMVKEQLDKFYETHTHKQTLAELISSLH
jgi:hypothetical protein